MIDYLTKDLQLMDISGGCKAGSVFNLLKGVLTKNHGLDVLKVVENSGYLTNSSMCERQVATT